ncbi:MAG: hypothetical protein JW908_04785 [Anaerolineales bacterium]|nr:hypothetical protein [Anaerolineales bacterium]
MKTSVIIAIVVGVAILAVLAGGVAGYFIARSQISSTSVIWKTAVYDSGLDFYGPSIMPRHWRGMDNPGMFGGTMIDRWQAESDRPRLKYMLDALAESLDTTSDSLKEELSSGKTIWDLASAQGIDEEDFGQFMIDAATNALNQMVADEELTQKQADAMLEQIQQRWENIDPENIPGIFMGPKSRSRTWRWHIP